MLQGCVFALPHQVGLRMQSLTNTGWLPSRNASRGARRFAFWALNQGRGCFSQMGPAFETVPFDSIVLGHPRPRGQVSRWCCSQNMLEYLIVTLQRLPLQRSIFSCHFLSTDRAFSPLFLVDPRSNSRYLIRFQLWYDIIRLFKSCGRNLPSGKYQ